MENNIILTSVPLNDLFAQIRQIVKEEVAKDFSKAEEKLLSPAETCKLFTPEISIQTLRNWTDKGLIKVHRLGGRLFFLQSEIVASLNTLKRYKHTPQSA